MSPVDVVEWVGALASMLGALLTAKRETRPRLIGFAVYAGANLVLIWWASATGKWGVFTMQLFFCYTTYVGLRAHWPHDPRSQP